MTQSSHPASVVVRQAEIIPVPFCSLSTPIEPPITWFKIFHFLQLLLICLFQQFSTCIGALQFGFLMKPPPCNSYYRQVDILPLCQSAADWASEPCSKPIFDLTGVWLTRLHCGPSYHCVRTQMDKCTNAQSQKHKYKLKSLARTHFHCSTFNIIVCVLHYPPCWINHCSHGAIELQKEC